LEPIVDGDETKVNGVSVGLADKWVVVPQETALVQAARESFNVSIKATAEANGFGFCRCKRHFDQLLNGGVLDGNFVTTAGMFWVDFVNRRLCVVLQICVIWDSGLGKFGAKAVLVVSFWSFCFVLF
jgi:hypothetical protein